MALWAPASVLTPSDTISALQFGPNDLVAVTSWDCSVRIANVKGDWSTHWVTSRPQFGACWSAREPRLYFGGAENRVSVIDCDSETKYDIFTTPSPVVAVTDLAGALAIATAQSAALHDVRQPDRGIDITDGAAGIVDVSADASSAHLVTADVEGYCRVWDIRNTKSPFITRKPLGGDSLLRKVQMQAGGELYAVSNSDSHVAIEHISTPNESFVFKSNKATSDSGTLLTYPIGGLAFEGSMLATAGGDKSVYVWDFKQRKLRRRMQFSMPCVAISYSRSGRYCAVGLANDEWRKTGVKLADASHTKVLITEIEKAS